MFWQINKDNIQNQRNTFWDWTLLKMTLNGKGTITNPTTYILLSAGELNE